MAFCANCGSKDIAEGQKFCTVCGARLDDADGSVTTLPSFPNQLPPSANVPGVAGFWWRVLSNLIDGIIIGLCVTLPLHVASASFYTAAVITLVVRFLYGYLFLSLWSGRTLGMAMCHMRCISASDGGALEAGQIARRVTLKTVLLAIGSFYRFTIYKYPDHAQSLQNTHHNVVRLALLLPYYLDQLWVAWDSKRQALHDKFAGTLVMRVPPQPKAVAYEIVSPHDPTH